MADQRFLTLLIASIAFATSASSAPPPAPPPWVAMDRGPYLTASIESGLPGRAMTPKGIMIRVNKTSRPAHVLFDSDLMRYSAAWTGDSINWRNVLFDGSHQTWPAVAGDQVFGTRMIPGWANDRGSFDDPRTRFASTDYKPQPAHWQNRAYGPLPHAWAQYKGLYLHGERVILSYTVANTAVLDSPGWDEHEGMAAAAAGIFTRTLNVSKASSDLVVEVLEHSSRELRRAGSIVVLGRPATPAVERPSTRPAPVAEGLIASWTPATNSATFEPREGAHAATMAGGQAGGAAAVEQGIGLSGGRHARIDDASGIDLSGDFSIAGWIKTNRGGTILSKTIEGRWVPGGKTLFIEDGNLTLDVGWVGAVRGGRSISDGRWHHVAATYRQADNAVALYVDGASDAAGHLKVTADPDGSQVRLGLTSADFPRGNGNRLEGALGAVCLYGRVLKPVEIVAMAGAQAVPVEHAVAAAVVGAPAGVAWDLSEAGQLRLRIPAATTPCRLKILSGRILSGGETAFAAVAAKDGGQEVENLSALTHGGPARWSQALITRGTLASSGGAYVADQIAVPSDNPWHALMRFGGFDFFEGGTRAALCTWDGDVWTVDGIDGSLAQLTWRRIATGLFQPLGLKIVADAQGKEQIYVCCRDQIVRLHDLNGDGEIDFYECFNNDHQVTEHFHEFALGLQTDAAKNFYYTKSARHALPSVVPQHGTLLRVSKDGSKTEIVCGGFRAANGFGLSEGGGEMAMSDQEGYWMPANRINLLKPGGFYGNLWSAAGRARTAAEGYDSPLCWLPVKVDRSPAEELWITSDHWGPLRGRMIHTSYGTGKLFLVLYETVNGVAQGGMVQLPGVAFKSGIMRGRFNSADGQLYLTGMVGWASNCAEPSGFYRVRYVAEKSPPCLPEGLHVTRDGLSITFTSPLDKAAAEDADSYAVKQWKYRWSERYGSPHFSVAQAGKEGEDDVAVAGVVLSEDRRMVKLQIPSIKPVMQMQVQFNVKDAAGNAVKMSVYNTINQVPQ